MISQGRPRLNPNPTETISPTVHLEHQRTPTHKRSPVNIFQRIIHGSTHHLWAREQIQEVSHPGMEVQNSTSTTEFPPVKQQLSTSTCQYGRHVAGQACCRAGIAGFPPGLSESGREYQAHPCISIFTPILMGGNFSAVTKSK